MNRKALWLGIITVIIWGSGFAAIRASLLGGYSAGHLVLTRFLIASSVFILYALWPGTSFRLPKKEDVWKIGLLGLIGISVYHIGVTFGEQTVSAGTAGMFIASAPIFTALIAVVVLKERLSVAGWIGMFIGILGVFCITLGSNETFSISTGAMLILMAAIATSIFFVFQKPFFLKYRPVELTAYFTWAGTIPFLIFAPGLLEGIKAATLEANISAIYMGIFPAAIAYVAWAIALSEGEAGTVASLLYAEPVVAIIVAWFWLQELPSMLSIIGGVIAISSVIIINWTGKQRKPPLIKQVNDDEKYMKPL